MKKIKMQRVLLSGLLLSLSCAANALEISGVMLAEKIQSGEQSLVLNGAGSRLMAGVFPVYVAALYLPEKRHAEAAVLDDGTSKRMVLSFLYDVTSAQLLEATYKLMSENHSAEELNKLNAGWKKFASIFDSIKNINKGDQIAVDYQSATGVSVSLNGKEIGRVAEAGFMHGFLKAWLGDRPVQVDLKAKLLGMPAADAK